MHLAKEKFKQKISGCDMNKVLITAVLLSLFTGTLAAEDFNLNYDFRFRYEYTDDSGKADQKSKQNQNKTWCKILSL